MKKKKKITNPRENLRKSIYFPINVSSIRCLYFVSNNKSNESWINRRTLNQIERIWIKLGVDRRRGWSLRASNDNTILTKRNPSSAWIWLSIESLPKNATQLLIKSNRYTQFDQANRSSNCNTPTILNHLSLHSGYGYWSIFMLSTFV